MPATRPRTRSAVQDGRRSRRGRRTFLLVLVFVVCAVVVDGLFGERGLLALVRTRQQHQELQAEVERARAANDRLRDEVRRLKDDPTAIEELARREFGLIKPGEKLFILRDVPSPGPAR